MGFFFSILPSSAGGHLRFVLPSTVAICGLFRACLRERHWHDQFKSRKTEMLRGQACVRPWNGFNMEFLLLRVVCFLFFLLGQLINRSLSRRTSLF